MPEKDLKVKKLSENESTIGIAADGAEGTQIREFIDVERKDSRIYQTAEAQAKKRGIPVEQVLAEIFSHGI